MKERVLFNFTVFVVFLVKNSLLAETSGDWTYTVTDNKATITSYSGDGGHVVIPAELNGIAVVKFGDETFRYNTSITSITIPDSVTSIGDSAFDSCTVLTNITIPDSVTSIGNFVFHFCTSLTSITIPDSVTSIGDYTFFYCTSLGSVTIPGSVTSIGANAFASCTSLTSITIPDSVTSIGKYTFASCTSLVSVNIPASVTSIAKGVFENCNSLVSVNIPDTVTSIGEFVFASCTSLGSVTIPSSVTSIGGNAFESCTSLVSVTILDGVTSIGGYAFAYCADLVSINIPRSVKSIGLGAFGYCTSLVSVTIPESVESIGDYAFYTCTSLASITIPDGVTSIGDSAFEGCTSLISVTLPILFVDSYTSFSLSSSQVLIYGSPAARDLPLSYNYASGRTSGRNDVTSDPSSYSLFTASDVSTAGAAARTIVNVSARVDLGQGEIVTPGFTVLGEQKKLLIRAVGPKLADLGVQSPMQNPTMSVYKSRWDGNPPDLVATIDDWKADNGNVAEIVAAMSSAGAFPLEPTETFQGRPFMTDDTSSAAALVTLDIGVYTVQVSSADDGVGEVLVEVYEITD